MAGRMLPPPPLRAPAGMPAVASLPPLSAGSMGAHQTGSADVPQLLGRTPLLPGPSAAGERALLRWLAFAAHIPSVKTLVKTWWGRHWVPGDSTYAIVGVLLCDACLHSASNASSLRF
jgi:hypothetical protein